MGLFDSLKKKELETILTLQKEVKYLKETIQILEAENASLKERNQFLEKYESISNIEKEIERRLNETDATISQKLSELNDQKEEIQNEIDKQEGKLKNLQERYAVNYETYKALQKESDIYRDVIELSEYGVYEPHFDFEMPEQYRVEMYGIQEQQKKEIRNGTAVLGGENIAWNGSISQGIAMVKKEKKLMLRAFNGECDSFIAEVEWNNIMKMELLIKKSRLSINKIYDEQGLYISQFYEDLKIKELRLAYEYKLKKHEEKEQQRAIREQMREEEKARREIEAALIKAQKDEETYQKALDKARSEIALVIGEKQIKLQQRIIELEARIAETEANKERALSMAQQTKRGHVYVISNIGSFGENVYKIGMTRRLEPMDRVRELGDASVPFPFDVHAIIFCEDAPALENKLHKAFDKKRLNLVNYRKEFFHVTLKEIEEMVRENHAEIEFTKIAEARDFRQSVALKGDNRQVFKASDFPIELHMS